MSYRCPLLLLVCSLLAIAPAARASDGRVEINGFAALAGGITSGDAAGFPIQITVSGSYVLTGNLTVPPDTSGIVISADDVHLDFAGFAMQGPVTCTSTSCPASIVSGISGALRSGTVVENGTVSGFGGTCINLGASARVERMTATSCGSAGITVGEGSLVLDSAVSNVGSYGMVVVEPGVRAGNVVGDVALAGAGPTAVFGGAGTRGNACRDRSCSGEPKRRYYLTKTTFKGSEVRSACELGYHAASIYELADPSALEYDPLLGDARETDPTGPISVNSGWVRTGSAASTVTNCSAWTSASNSHDGTVAILQGFVSSMNEPAQRGSPWSVFSGTASCFNAINVWCIED